LKKAPKRHDSNSFPDYIWILAAIVAFILALPFTITINDFLTTVAIRTGAYEFIVVYIAPFAAQMVTVILHYVFGLSSTAYGTLLTTSGVNGEFTAAIVWNCVGWQSLLLYGLTLVVGLKGHFTRVSKILCVLIGVEGTVMINLFRMATVIAIAVVWSPNIGLAFHEYAGTVILLLWLTGFWLAAYKFILQPRTSKSVTETTTVIPKGLE
jgi:exosortase/archaeosortase family protein